MTPYSEASLILAVLTREGGQLHFMLRGARRTGKKSFPEADLFRCLDIQYRYSAKANLQTARKTECIRNFDAIARFPAQYRSAGWIARFALENSVANQPVPMLYEATIVAFDRLSRPGAPCFPIILGICFATMQEHGLLPDLSASPAKQAHLQAMLDYAYDLGLEPPEHPGETWTALRQWCFRYMLRVGLHVAAGWNKLPEA